MTGTCVNTIKLIGLGSLGLLTGSLAYQSVQVIPKLIHELNYHVTNKGWSLVKCGKLLNRVLLGVATSCFVLSYRYSPVSEQHPYLIYALLGSCGSFGYTYIQSCKHEKTLNKFDTIKPTPKPAPAPAPAPKLAPKADDELGKSYIHVSDEDSTSATTTPSHSTPNSPKAGAATAPEFQPEEEEDIEAEVSMALFKKEMVNNLVAIKSIYLVGTGCFGLTFLITSVGVLGEFIMG